MAINTTTVTVNAAFLQEIKEDNRRLKELFCELEVLCARERWTSARRRKLAALLSQLRDQLAMHFALEEAYGYFDDPVATAPRLCDAADALRNEHEGLFRWAGELADDAEQCIVSGSASAMASRVAGQFRAFHDAFRQHEACENELILEALDDDIGVGD